MQFTVLAAATLLAATVSAYEVLTPTLNATVAKGESLTIDWTAVDTDAEVFSIYLTNFQTAHWPPTVLSLAQNVPRDDLSIDLRIPCDVSSDYGWQINFINGTNTYVIYAQSAVFSLTGDCVEPEPTKAPYPTGYSNTTVTYPGTTVTLHETKTSTLCKTVSTVVYATPIVWFVEPSKEAVCELPAHETITVTVGPSGYPIGTSGPSDYPVSTGGPIDYPSQTGGYAAPTTYAHVTPTPQPTGAVYPTTPAFTGAASAVKVSGMMAMVVGAVAFLL